MRGGERDHTPNREGVSSGRGAIRWKWVRERDCCASEYHKRPWLKSEP